MSKLSPLFILLILISTLLSSCNVRPPRDRPTISNVQNATIAEEEVEEKTEPPKRPDGAIVINSDICACKNRKAISVGNCAATCSTKTAEAPSLHFTVTPTAEVELSDLQDLFGWCTQEIIDPETGVAVEGQTNPACIIEAIDENNSATSLNFSPVSGSKNVTVDISALAENITYRFRILETTSGASSNFKQLRLITSNENDDFRGPLALAPVTQYTCMSVTTSSDQVDLFFDEASRLFFYFIPETRPDPLPSGSNNLYCHDKFIFGDIDSDVERLEETPGAFTLWDRGDSRFFNLNNTGSEFDINDIIEQNVKDTGASLGATPNLFFKFEWFGAPEIVQDGDQGSGTPRTDHLGFYMTPFIDQDTLRSFCPKQEHYFSDNPLFQAMRDIIGVDTEGIYIGKQVNSDQTFVLARETQLKQIWFFKENGVNIQPNNETIKGKKIQFYWPPDFVSPFIKKSHQTTYTILSTTDLKNLNGAGSSTSQADSTASTGDGASSSFLPHDKRIGCIPVTDN